MNSKRQGPPNPSPLPRGAGARNPRTAGKLLCFAAAVLALCAGRVAPANASPALVIEMPSGAILYEDEATQPWYPASLTKLMTVYVALSAVRDHRISFDTPLMVSARAASMPPSKMGFRPGTLVSLDNALKMLMVKSPNDIAVTIAEGVSGSVEAFADDMNGAAQDLGLTQSHFANPNGLPNPAHFSSARDLAILARALYLTFPEQARLFNIGALRLGDEIIHNHNDLLGRYPGADGMKTGFTCAAGFNVVASATQGGRQLIAVILGAPNARSRMIMAAALFDRGFARIDQPSKSLADLAAQTAANSPALPPDMHQSSCSRRAKAMAEFDTNIARVMAPLLASNSTPPAAPEPFALMTAQAVARPLPMATHITLVPRPAFEPVPVYLGSPAGYAGLVAQARPPHSSIGTAGPPAAVSAYAAPEAAAPGEKGLPLAADAGALPMKGPAAHAKAAGKPHVARHAVTRAGRHGSPKGAKTAAKTKVEKLKKTMTKQLAKQPPAKAAKYAEKTKSKKPEKHAGE